MNSHSRGSAARLSCLDTDAHLPVRTLVCSGEEALHHAYFAKFRSMPLPDNLPPTMVAEEFEWENNEKSLTVSALRGILFKEIEAYHPGARCASACLPAYLPVCLPAQRPRDQGVRCGGTARHSHG